MTMMLKVNQFYDLQLHHFTENYDQYLLGFAYLQKDSIIYASKSLILA